MTKHEMGDAITECIDFLYDYKRHLQLTDDDIQDICERFTLTYIDTKGTSPRTWATYLTKQHLYSKNRPAQKRTGDITRLDHIDAADDFHSALHDLPTDEMEEAEQDALIVATVQHLMKCLTSKQKHAIQEVWLNGRSQKEVADEMGTTRQNVNLLITTAIKKMRWNNKGNNPFIQ